jgi:hypothetical protein
MTFIGDANNAETTLADATEFLGRYFFDSDAEEVQRSQEA